MSRRRTFIDRLGQGQLSLGILEGDPNKRRTAACPVNIRLWFLPER